MSVQKPILLPLLSLKCTRGSTNLHTLEILTQGLLRLFPNFPKVNQLKASLSWMIQMMFLQKAVSSFECLHPHLASKAEL